MKTNRQIMMEQTLLEKMDNLRRLQRSLDWATSLMDDLVGVIIHLEVRDPEVAELLWKVYRPLDRKADSLYAMTCQLEEEIDRLYADLLVQGAEAIEEDLDADQLVHPALQQMPPPYIAQQRANYYDPREAQTYDWRATSPHSTGATPNY